MTLRMILMLALALLAAGRAQCQSTFENGPSPDFLESTVSYEYNPTADQTAEDFIANISARSPGCEEQWIVDESAMILECLTQIGRDDALLQFRLDWYPNEGISRVRAFDGVSGEQFDYVRYMLDLLPRTASELEEQAEIEARWQRLQILWASEYYRGPIGCTGLDAEQIDRLRELRNEMRDFHPGSLPILQSGYWDHYVTQGWVSPSDYQRHEFRLLELLAEWKAAWEAAVSLCQ